VKQDVATFMSQSELALASGVK